MHIDLSIFSDYSEEMPCINLGICKIIVIYIYFYHSKLFFKDFPTVGMNCFPFSHAVRIAQTIQKKNWKKSDQWSIKLNERNGWFMHRTISSCETTGGAERKRFAHLNTNRFLRIVPSSCHVESLSSWRNPSPLKRIFSSTQLSAGAVTAQRGQEDMIDLFHGEGFHFYVWINFVYFDQWVISGKAADLMNGLNFKFCFSWIFVQIC